MCSVPLTPALIVMWRKNNCGLFVFVKKYIPEIKKSWTFIFELAFSFVVLWCSLAIIRSFVAAILALFQFVDGYVFSVN